MDKDSKNAINELISNQKPQNELWKGTELFLWNASSTEEFINGIKILTMCILQLTPYGTLERAK